MTHRPWLQLAFVIGEAVLTLFSGGVIFIIISRAAGPEVLGTYALALAWLAVFQGVSSFGIPEYILREAGAHGRDAAGQVLHAMLLGLGSGFVAICLMLIAVRFLGYSPYVVQVITSHKFGVDPGLPQHLVSLGVRGPAPNAIAFRGGAGRGRDHDVRQPIFALCGLRRRCLDGRVRRRQDGFGVLRRESSCSAGCFPCGQPSIPECCSKLRGRFSHLALATCSRCCRCGST